MSKSVYIVVFSILFLSGCAGSGKIKSSGAQQTTAGVVSDDLKDHVWDFRDATTWLLGDINPEWLMRDPHAGWYSKGYSDYTPDEKAMEELADMNKDSLKIIVVLGTWCPDSRREVPHFMKILDICGYPQSQLRMIGVDIDKVAPLGDFPLLGIKRVPTFIFYKNNIELGRIIEVPVTSLEQDMVKILKKQQTNNK